MRVVNIGFNVQTDKAVKSLTDIEKKLISINTALEEKHKIQIDSSGIENSIKKIKESVSKTKDIEIISDKSINSSINKIEVLNEEITKMRTTLNKPNNISDKSVLEFSKKLYDLTKRLESMKEVTSDKDLMKGLNSKELAILNVEMKDLTSQTNKIKSIMSGLTDNSFNFIKALENTNVKASILEKTLEEIKRQAIIEGKIDIKTNSEQTLKDLKLLKRKVTSAYNTKDMFDLNEIELFISKIDSKSKQLKKDMVAPTKSILTQAKVGDIYSVQEMPKVVGISSLSKSLRVMSLEINDIVSNMSDKGFHEISNDASILNSRVLELVNSLGKVKTESEIPEVIHQFNTLKNELKDIKKIQSESDMKTVKSIITPQKQGVLYSVKDKPTDTSIDSTIKKLLKVEEGLSHIGKNLGETSKLDTRSLMLYGKEAEKIKVDLDSLFSIFKNKEILGSFKGDDLLKLQLHVESTIKGFNKLESSVGKFNSEGLKTIETLEKQARALEVLKKQTESQKQIAIFGNNQEQIKSADSILRSIEKVQKSLTSTAFNPDYTQVEKTNEHIKGLESSFSKLKKEIATPIKAEPLDPLSKQYDNLIYKLQTLELEKKKMSGILSSSNVIPEQDKIKITSKLYKTDEISSQLKTAISVIPEIEGKYSKETLTELQFKLKEYEATVKDTAKEIEALNTIKPMKNMDSSIDKVELLKEQLKMLINISPTERAEKGFRDVAVEASHVIAELNKLKHSMGTIDDESDIPKLNAQLIKLKSEFNSLQGAKLPTAPKQNKTSINDLIGTYAIFNTAKAQLSNFMELEDATYNLGVVAQFSEYQIQQMRQSIIDMSTDLPQSSIEITKAMDAVMRTGKSYEEARVIVQKTSKLATASGESLGDAVGIVNKLFLALGVNATKAEDVDKALQQMHATAVFTATDLEGLGESAKQYAGALSTLAKTTSYSGKELDDYKISLLALGTTFSGILSNMGRSAEQSGGQTLCPFVTRVA